MCIGSWMARSLKLGRRGRVLKTTSFRRDCLNFFKGIHDQFQHIVRVGGKLIDEMEVISWCFGCKMALSEWSHYELNPALPVADAGPIMIPIRRGSPHQPSIITKLQITINNIILRKGQIFPSTTTINHSLHHQIRPGWTPRHS